MTAPQQAGLMNSEVMLTVVNGPERGVSYKLTGQALTLGRAPENDIVLQDPKASRQHARIENRQGTYWVSDLGSQNGIIINGQAVRETALKPGDHLVVGTTELRFGPSQALSVVNTAPPFNPDGGTWTPPLTQQRTLIREDNQSSKWIGAFLAVGVLIFVVTMNRSSQRGSVKLKDDAALQEEIDKNIESNEKRQEEIFKKGKDTQQYSEAQAFYQRGFREFRENNYSRAIQNFEASLALYPNHPLAKRYLERSRLKLNEVIMESLERGERYFQLQKYSNARSEYQAVLNLSGENKSKSVQLAQKRLEAINLILMNNK